MTDTGESGYILASVLAGLLSISLVAAALVSSSVDMSRRAAAAEKKAADQAALKSALIVAGSELARDVAHRKLKFVAGVEALQIAGRTVRLTVSWESDKLDINAASPADIKQSLDDRSISQSIAAQALDAVAKRRASKTPIRLVDDIARDEDTAWCLSQALTVFGGRLKSQDSSEPTPPYVGQPAPGSHLNVLAELEGPHEIGLDVVLLMTGDPKAPVRTLDWRHTRKSPGEACHAS
jgi:hypothetical protein